jgi:hypothetical protein
LSAARLVWAVLLVSSVGTLALATWVDPSFASVLGWRQADYHAAAGGLGLSPTILDAIHILLAIVTRLSFIGMGALLFWRKGQEPFALFASTFLITFSVTAVFVGETAMSDPLVAGPLNALLALGQACMVIFLYTFPDGRWVPRGTGWPTLAAVVILFGARFEAVRSWSLFQLLGVPAVIWMFGCVPAQVYRYRRIASPAQRQQIKWGVFGIALNILVSGLTWAIFGYYLPEAFPVLRQPSPEALRYQFVRTLVMSFAALSLPVSLGVAVLRYRLWEIDVIIRRTLVYSTLTGLLALAYFGSVLILQSLSRGLTGDAQSPLITVASTLAIAALSLPLRRRVQAFIDRRFYRRKVDAARTLAAFAATARDETDLERLAARLVQVVQETMRPEPVALWLKRSENRGNESELSVRNAFRNESRTSIE